MEKDVIDFENEYTISENGVVKSKDRLCVDSLGRKRFRKGKELTPDVAQNGYLRVTLAKNGRKKQVYLHRLLAIHFIDNPKGLPQVNHIDGDKLNNEISNLEWCTVQENTIHAYKLGLIRHVSGKNHPNYGKTGGNSKKARKITATDVRTNQVKTYNSIIETKQDGFTPSEVSRSCNHGGTHKGFIFKFTT